MTGTVITSVGTTWAVWTSSASDSSTTSAAVTWDKWTTASDSSSTGSPSASIAGTWQTDQRPRRSAEDVARDQEVAERRKRKQKAANEAAERLLLRHLNPRQKVSYRKDKTFRVRTDAGNVYEIDCQKRWHNIFQVVGGRRTREFCIYAGDSRLPLGDNWLAQKLLLEHDEERFRRIANSTPLYTAG